MSAFIITLMVLGGGLLAASFFLLARVQRNALNRRADIRREQMMFEQRLRHLTQLAVSAMRAEARRSSRDA